jgi:hypothetical protein
MITSLQLTLTPRQYLSAKAAYLYEDVLQLGIGIIDLPATLVPLRLLLSFHAGGSTSTSRAQSGRSPLRQLHHVLTLITKGTIQSEGKVEERLVKGSKSVSSGPMVGDEKSSKVCKASREWR